MGTLKVLDGIASKLKELRASDMGPARKRREEDRLVASILETLRLSIVKQARRKGLLEHLDEVMQHSMIAINQSIKTWDADIASFSTHVHWQLRAEMRSLELFLFPQRRTCMKGQDYQTLSFDYVMADEESFYSKIPDPVATEATEAEAELHLARRRLETAMAAYLAPRIRSYECFGCVDTTRIINGMRGVHIYILREIEGMDANEIGLIFGISRERVRQIAKAVSADITDRITNPDHARLSHDDAERFWLLANAIYFEAVAVDIRLIKNQPLQAAVTYERPAVATKAPTFTFPADQQDEGAKRKPRAQVIKPVFKKVEEKKPAAAKKPAPKRPAANGNQLTFPLAAIAACALGEAGKSFLQSPQILPEPRNDGEGAKIATGNWHAAAIAAIALSMGASLPQEAEAKPISCDAACKEGGDEGFAVKLGSYSDLGELRTAAKAAQKNQKLAQLRPAVVNDRANDRVSLAFAPVNWREAERLCSDIKSRGDPCSVVRVAR